MNLSNKDKWILTNIYDLPAGQGKYNELYDEDDFIIINEDSEYFEVIPDNTTLI
jgi:hypothetical protein